jgi:periplasmic divalent cation tolerance protein
MTHLLYITCPTHEEACRIGRTLVEERLAACANILPGITSIFCWENKMQEASEVVIIAKTTAERLETAIARIKALHSYDCPCVVAVKIDGGNEDFLRWVAESCAP